MSLWMRFICGTEFLVHIYKRTKDRNIQNYDLTIFCACISECTKICFQKENFKLILVAKWLFFGGGCKYWIVMYRVTVKAESVVGSVRDNWLWCAFIFKFVHDEFCFKTNTVLCHFLKHLPCAVRIVACSVMLHCLAAFLLYAVLLYYSKVKILAEIIWFWILWNDSDTCNYSCILVSETSPWRWWDYWPKYVGEDIIN